jgi:hypothetical protein
MIPVLVHEQISDTQRAVGRCIIRRDMDIYNLSREQRDRITKYLSKDRF